MFFGLEAERHYQLDDVKGFGDRLLTTEDLDPVYVAAAGAKLPERQLKRLLLAYWCFYSLGAAAYLSERSGKEYWKWMGHAAENTDKWLAPVGNGRWPRGAERRHFRGNVCIRAVATLVGAGEPERLVDALIEPMGGSNSLSLECVVGRVKGWPLFGPWIAFKAADMLERLLGVDIAFPIDLTMIYAEPAAALDLLPGDPLTNTKLLIKYFATKHKAPPSRDRACNVQEVETVLCKWKSSVNKHYWVGKDIHEIRLGLAGWGDTAQQLLRSCPVEVVRGLS